ncbi:hypothetical protein BGW80DRAFT_376283 [Lactifluus volemus]|nr:hypothetical protein BGW80DRAFT_376283 [Lactifluus volemus]
MTLTSMFCDVLLSLWYVFPPYVFWIDIIGVTRQGHAHCCNLSVCQSYQILFYTASLCGFHCYMLLPCLFEQGVTRQGHALSVPHLACNLKYLVCTVSTISCPQDAQWNASGRAKSARRDVSLRGSTSWYSASTADEIQPRSRGFGDRSNYRDGKLMQTLGKTPFSCFRQSRQELRNYQILTRGTDCGTGRQITLNCHACAWQSVR